INRRIISPSPKTPRLPSASEALKTTILPASWCRRNNTYSLTTTPSHHQHQQRVSKQSNREPLSPSSKTPRHPSISQVPKTSTQPANQYRNKQHVRSEHQAN